METGTPETIKEVTNISELEKEIGDTKSSHGTGGITSKIIVIQITQKAGIKTWVVNGLNYSFLINTIEDKIQFSKILF